MIIAVIDVQIKFDQRCFGFQFRTDSMFGLVTLFYIGLQPYIT